MGKEEIFDYVMDTPGNTNPNVLRSLLDSNGGDLPPVTAEDNGKLLGVVNGEWAAGVQEYWIPVEYSEGTLSIPEDKIAEVSEALLNQELYWVRGIEIGTKYYAGYAENREGFIVPLDKTFMEGLGYDCAGKLHITQNSDGFVVNIELDKFIVTLTPTALDYSGMMDKTVAEINAAYEAGMELVFRVMMSETTHMDVDCTARWYDDSTYPSFNGFIIMYPNNVIVFAYTGATNDGTEQTYGTIIYPLTQGDNTFVVTLTPTALDYSGTMDKTPQEITEAYNAGMKVVFEIPSLSSRVDADQYLNSGSNIQCGAKVFYDFNGSPVLITIVTNDTDDTQTYGTSIFSLTPAS